jgi:hypothetical protein
MENRKLNPAELSDFVVAVRDMQSYCRELELLQRKGSIRTNFKLSIAHINTMRRYADLVSSLSTDMINTLVEFGEENLQQQVKEYPLMNVPE